MLGLTHAQDGFTIKDLHEWSRGGAAAVEVNNSLSIGEQLREGNRLTSANGSHYLIMQDDGNLCIYRTADNGFVWCTMAYGFSGGFLFMQKDGNLVVYDGDGGYHWSSETHPHFNARFGDPNNKPVKLVIENNGKLNLYSKSGAVVWSNQ